MTNVIELIGLPGSGKSYYTSSISRDPNYNVDNYHIVNRGIGKEKFYNIMRAIKNEKVIFLLICLLFVLNIKSSFNRIEARPYLVVLERLGRIRSINTPANSSIFVDEGALQFMWRIFCNIKLNKINLYIGKCILTRLLQPDVCAQYLFLGRERHLARVSRRNKNQKFDIALMSNDVDYIKRCRKSMYLLVVFLRQSPMTLTSKRI